jgi:hypothetical protein
MNRKILAIPILILAASMAIILVAQATPPTYVSGGWGGYNQQGSLANVAGGNVFLTVENDGTYTAGGPITGTFHQVFTQIYHFGSPKVVSTLTPSTPQLNPPCDFNWVDMDRVFESATVLGHTGGLTMRLQAKGYGNPFAGTAAWELHGTWVIIDGTGDLEGVHGQGTWWHSRTVAGLRYEGQIHFDP